MTETRTLDARGLKCPMPIVKARKELDTLPAGGQLEVTATDPGSVLDFQGWVKTSGRLELLAQREAVEADGRRVFIHVLRKKP